MNNVFVYFIAFVSTLQIYSNVIVTYKIDSTISLINEEVVASCVSESSKLLASEYNDLSLLELDHNLLMYVVENTLNDNLSFCDIDVKYYFYDSITLVNCPIGLNYCNSVQLNISLDYKNKTYERTLRYEPIKT